MTSGQGISSHPGRGSRNIRAGNPGTSRNKSFVQCEEHVVRGRKNEVHAYRIELRGPSRRAVAATENP